MQRTWPVVTHHLVKPPPLISLLPPLTPHSRTPSRPAALPCRCVINILEILDILKQHPNIQV